MADWTPIAKTHMRVQRAEVEERGSMQHFAAALHLSDVMTKLHALTLIGILERYEQASPSPLSFALSRAASTGPWVAALREAAARVQPMMIQDATPAEEWLTDFRMWLSRKKGRSDEDSLATVLSPVAELAELLKRDAGDNGAVSAARTPLDLMLCMVEIRNKTTGHHAYGSEFWAAHVGAARRSGVGAARKPALGARACAPDPAQREAAGSRARRA